MSEISREVTIVTGPDGLDHLHQDWQGLIASQAVAPFYTLYEWYFAYMTCLEASPEQVMFVVLRRKDRCVGIVPLVQRRLRSPIFSPAVLESPKLTGMDLVGLPLDENESLSEWWLLICLVLKQHGIRWSALRLPGFLISPLSQQPLVNMAPWMVVRVQGHSCWFNCRQDYGYLYEAYASRLVKILRKAKKGLAKAGSISIQTVTSSPELACAYDEFLRLEASGWKGEQGSSTALKLDQKRRHFLETVLFRNGRNIQTEINLLKIDQQAIAAQLCIRRGGSLSLLKIAFDQTLSRFSPGSVLLDKLLAQSCEDEMTDRVSLVTGQPWMAHWKPEQFPVADLWLFHHRLLARLARMFLELRDQLKVIKLKWRSL